MTAPHGYKDNQLESVLTPEEYELFKAVRQKLVHLADRTVSADTLSMLSGWRNLTLSEAANRPGEAECRSTLVEFVSRLDRVIP